MQYCWGYCNSCQQHLDCNACMLQIAHEQPFFDHMQADPAMAHYFSKAMAFQEGFSISALLTGAPVVTALVCAWPSHSFIDCAPLLQIFRLSASPESLTLAAGMALCWLLFCRSTGISLARCLTCQRLWLVQSHTGSRLMQSCCLGQSLLAGLSLSLAGFLLPAQVAAICSFCDRFCMTGLTQPAAAFSEPSGTQCRQVPLPG